jgi:hypothetical protein
MANRRGNGEGSITRRKNGGWCAQYVVFTTQGRKPWTNGAQKPLSCPCPSLLPGPSG